MRTRIQITKTTTWTENKSTKSKSPTSDIDLQKPVSTVIALIGPLVHPCHIFQLKVFLVIRPAQTAAFVLIHVRVEVDPFSVIRRRGAIIRRSTPLRVGVSSWYAAHKHGVSGALHDDGLVRGGTDSCEDMVNWKYVKGEFQRCDKVILRIYIQIINLLEFVLLIQYL